MRRVVLCAALVGLVTPAGAGAQTLMLTEADALARLSTNGPRVQAIRAGIEVARVDVLRAGRWPNPRLVVDRESVAGTTEYITTLAQPLPVTGRRGYEEQAASAMVLADSSRADDQVRRLRTDLRLAFADLVAAQSRERALTVAGDRLRDLAGLLARREVEGDAAGFDRLRAEREVLDVETDLMVASTERARAQAILAGFFDDISDPAGLAAVEQASPGASVPPLKALLEIAERARGELVALGHERDAAEFAASAAGRRVIPEPEIVAGTKSSTALGGDLGSVIAVYATLPLFDQARPEKAMAAARAAQAEARAASFRVVLRSQVAALREIVIQRRAASTRYRAEAVDSAAQIERIAQVSYDAGERGILELLDAYRIGASARVRQAALELAVRQAEIELEFATGWEATL